MHQSVRIDRNSLFSIILFIPYLHRTPYVFDSKIILSDWHHCDIGRPAFSAQRVVRKLLSLGILHTCAGTPRIETSRCHTCNV